MGFGLEFTGMELGPAGRYVVEALQGDIAGQTTAELTIQSRSPGEFKVEIDRDYLKKTASDNSISEQRRQLLREVASPFVPVEVVCPPIAMTELASLDPLVEKRRSGGARGIVQAIQSTAELPILGVQWHPE